MSYATPDDLKARYDARLIGDLISDQGVQVTGAALDVDLKLQAALDDAAGAMDAAFLQGARYSMDDINGLMAGSTNSRSHVVRINCDIAIMYLADRRVHARANETLERIMERAQTYLKQLKTGEDLFEIPAKVAASVPKVAGPTTQQLTLLNTIRRRTNHYFPNEILPNNR